MKPISRKSGFSLVEIMVVVVIIGLLASIAIPAFNRVRVTARASAFANDMRTFVTAAETYLLETGMELEDSSTGNVPTGWAEYIPVNKWTSPTPIGGSWDMEIGALGVVGYDFTEQELTELDAMHDDGSLTTGSVRKIAGDRYYHVMY